MLIASLKRFPDRSDELVSTATSRTVSYGGISYKTTSQNVTGLLPAGSTGVNHGANPRNSSISGLDIISIGIAQDGVVVLLTVTIQ